MNEHEDSLTNESFFSTAECEELRKKITLSSTELIELTYHDQKFMQKLEELNKTAINLFEEDHYLQAGVYWDEAERILQYAAGCGKTIERTLITTILNNQASLLQRTSELEQSANYLQAIIYNIQEFVEGYQKQESSSESSLGDPSQLGTYIEKKQALALYQLRFCALSSHLKNNQVALKTAKKALNTLKQLCKEQYAFETSKDKTQIVHKQLSEAQTLQMKNILKDLSNLKAVDEHKVNDFQLFLEKACRQINAYTRKLQAPTGCPSEITALIQNYTIGNLMQASPLPLTQQLSPSEYLLEQLARSGKLFKVIYLSIAHFTVATELRLISHHKYSLDEDERKSSLQFKESRINHILSLILMARYMPCKSVLYEHSLNSFKNHYGIDLLELSMNCIPQHSDEDFSITESDPYLKEQSKGSSECRLEEAHTNEEEEHPNLQSVEIHHSEPIEQNQLAINMLSQQYGPISPRLIKEVRSPKNVQKKLKQLKSKSKTPKSTVPVMSSRMLESTKPVNQLTSRNKQNKSKSRMLASKDKQTIRSRRKIGLKTDLGEEENTKGIYYGGTNKSRSKSKQSHIERKNSKKGLLTMKSGVVFENKKIKSTVYVEQEYGVKSAGIFGDYGKQPKHRLRYSQGVEENIYLQRSTVKSPTEPLKIKKLKSPTRLVKNQASTKRKSLSKDRYFI